MHKTIDMMNEFCYVLTRMEQNGAMVDMEALAELRVEYEAELVTLTARMDELVREVMGDTPFKLSSSDDLSKIIFSRQPFDKAKWKEFFNLGTEMVNGVAKPKLPRRMTPVRLGDEIENRSFLIMKTIASQCPACNGSGKMRLKTKSGAWHKRPPKCPTCLGCGILYTPTREIAGFKQGVRSTEDLASHGYKCGKEVLTALAERAKDDKAKQFLEGMVRFNAITSYLTNYVGGIEKYISRDGILHSQFRQCVTATGRLSSRAPNIHNQPRGGTFPIRKVFVSRFGGGSITEGDYAQLEFRVAAALAHCPVALQDIIDGLDVHQHTADVLTAAGQPTSRQDAKTHTFKPLYGGMSGSKAEVRYYKGFVERYHGIKAWHKKLLDIAVVHKSLSLPSGRPYKFPWAKKTQHGGVSEATKIKNYPVQGFATADMVPMGCISVYNLFQEAGLKSLLINEVHDSIVVDTYPGEEADVASLMMTGMLSVRQGLRDRFDWEFEVPIEVEIKRGPNWLEMDVVAEGKDG